MSKFCRIKNVRDFEAKVKSDIVLFNLGITLYGS